jgi:hypothetical protein
MTHERGPTDPVLVRRARISRAATIGQRMGYLLFGAAALVFFIGFAVGFTGLVVFIIEAALIGGSIVLAPSIVLSFAIRAADRADRDNDWR